MAIKIGDVFGKLTVISFPEGGPRAAKKAGFRCECGTEKEIKLGHVTGGATVSCGCVKRKTYVNAGDVYGRLTVVNAQPVRMGGHLKILCQCECGAEKLIGLWDVAHGGIRSCGCLVAEQIRTLNLKHGDEGTRLYSIWHGINARCKIPSAGPYSRYGGRGIAVCPEWSESFVAFRDWAISAGYEPELQIDRIDNDGDYEPTNCRWVTPMENANNRGNHRMLTAFGETKTMAEWGRDPRCAVSMTALKQRVRMGSYSDQEAITLQKGRYGGQLRGKPKQNVRPSAGQS